MQEYKQQLNLDEKAGFDLEAIAARYREKALRTRHGQLLRLVDSLQFHARAVKQATLKDASNPLYADNQDAKEAIATTAVNLMRICALLDINLEEAMEQFSEEHFCKDSSNG